MIPQPRDMNELRRLLASGAITQADLAGMTIRGSLGPSAPALEVAPPPQAEATQNELARALSPQEQFAADGEQGDLPMGTMRNEQTGRVTYFRPGGGFGDRPMPARDAPRARVRVVGVGPSGQTDHGEEDARPMPIDYTRPGIEIAGLGKGRYTADGRHAIIQNPDGSQTKVVLGYDAEGSARRNLQALKMREAESELALRDEQVGLLRDKRRMLAEAPAQPQPAQRARGAQAVGADGEAPLPKMTESQSRALAFGMRAANSSEILDLVGQGGKIQPGLIKRTAEALPGLGFGFNEGLGTMLNWTQSPEQQQVEQAQRDFINAVLRRESGAVISDSEFANARTQYFPQPGDSPEVIAQKRRNRALAIEGFAQDTEPLRPGLIKSKADQARALFDARAAIRKGADRGAVLQRLRQFGISESEL